MAPPGLHRALGVAGRGGVVLAAALWIGVGGWLHSKTAWFRSDPVYILILKNYWLRTRHLFITCSTEDISSCFSTRDSNLGSPRIPGSGLDFLYMGFWLLECQFGIHV